MSQESRLLQFLVDVGLTISLHIHVHHTSNKLESFICYNCHCSYLVYGMTVYTGWHIKSGPFRVIACNVYTTYILKLYTLCSKKVVH